MGLSSSEKGEREENKDESGDTHPTKRTISVGAGNIFRKNVLRVVHDMLY